MIKRASSRKVLAANLHHNDNWILALECSHKTFRPYSDMVAPEQVACKDCKAEGRWSGIHLWVGL